MNISKKLSIILLGLCVALPLPTLAATSGGINTAKAEITPPSSSRSSKPTIRGTAEGTKTIKVVLRKEGQTKNFYKGKIEKVRKGVWKEKITKKLPDGIYDVLVFGDKRSGKDPLATAKLAIGKAKIKETKNEAKADTTLVVSPVPLLFGGTARAGESKPVSYLQITNVGTQSATLKGFWIKQNGTTPVGAIIGLSTVDDKGGSRGSVGGVEGATPFQNGSAFAPVTDVTLAPGQMKLFTIRTQLSANVLPYLGTSLVINVTSLDTSAKVVKALFPIAGTTWTVQ